MTPLRAVDSGTRVSGEKPGRFSPDPPRASPPRSPICQAPICVEPPVHRHHILPRSLLDGPYDFAWIDGELVKNVADLCRVHHDQLESQYGGCKARLRWLNTSWVWYQRIDEEWIASGKDAILWGDDNGVVWRVRGWLKGGPWITK
jgi:hypothetical protein